jgi:hypothetical protein
MVAEFIMVMCLAPVYAFVEQREPLWDSTQKASNNFSVEKGTRLAPTEIRARRG